MSAEQPIHTPYQALNLYYYDRPYQYWQSAGSSQLPSHDQMLRESMNQVYEQRAASNSPMIGAVDSLEFSDLPSQLRNAKLER